VIVPRVLRALATGAWIGLLAGCQGPTTNDIVIAPGDQTLYEGRDIVLAATLPGGGMHPGPVLWSAADPRVVTVTATGSGSTAVARAVARGVTTVSASSTAGALPSDHITLTVLEAAEVKWTRQFGSPSYDSARSVATTADGRIVVAGGTGGDLEGAGTATGELFVRMFDGDGHVLWTRQFGSVGGTIGDQTGAVTTHASNRLIVVGTVYGTLPSAQHLGGADAFVRVYDDSGSHVWTSQFGTFAQDLGHAVVTDPGGRVIVVGATAGALQNENLGDRDAFVRVYGPDGDLLWTRQFGTERRDEATAVAVGNDGRIFVSGTTYGDLDGEIGGGDVFVRALDADGETLWTRQLGTEGTDMSADLAVDPTGAVLVPIAGEGGPGRLLVLTADGDDKDSAPLVSPLGLAVAADGEIVSVTSVRDGVNGPHAGKNDVGVQRVAPDGRTLWFVQFGTSSHDIGTDVALLPDGDAIVVGYTDGGLIGMNAGQSDVFLRRIGP
jgi:hypothetical protein